MDDATHRRLHDAIVRLADGDRTAFAPLFAELWPLVLRFVSRALNHAPDAEDVAQRVLMSVYFRIAEVDRSRDGVAWAFGIAAWEIRTHLRRVQRRREAPLTGTLVGAGASESSPEEQVVQRNLETTLQEALDALTGPERAALVASPVQASGAPATPAERKRRQRALDHLRAIWRERYD